MFPVSLFKSSQSNVNELRKWRFNPYICTILTKKDEGQLSPLKIEGQMSVSRKAKGKRRKC